MEQVAVSLDEKIAFDVALLPSGKIEQLAFRFNAELSGVRAGIYPLFQRANEHGEGCLPHLTLAQGFFYKKDEERIKKRLQKLASKIARGYDVSLKVTNAYAHVLPNRQTIMGLAVEKNPVLQHLHQQVMLALKRVVDYEGDLSGFYRRDGEVLDGFSLHPIITYRETAYNNFFPHITLGIGKKGEKIILDKQLENLDEQLEEEALVLALTQLGNYCTVRRILGMYSLEK